MATYIVAYDLYKQGQDYEALTKHLSSFPTHWRMQQSVWVVETPHSAAHLRDILTPYIDQSDNLIVAALAGEAAWRGYPANISEWIKGRLAP